MYSLCNSLTPQVSPLSSPILEEVLAQAEYFLLGDLVDALRLPKVVRVHGLEELRLAELEIPAASSTKNSRKKKNLLQGQSSAAPSADVATEVVIDCPSNTSFSRSFESWFAAVEFLHTYGYRQFDTSQAMSTAGISQQSIQQTRVACPSCNYNNTVYQSYCHSCGAYGVSNHRCTSCGQSQTCQSCGAFLGISSTGHTFYVRS